jgi:hypothetical protein
MAAPPIQESAGIQVGRHVRADRIPIQQFETVVPVSFPFLFLLLEFPQLTPVERGNETARTQVAIDVVAFDEFADDVRSFERHRA